MKKYFLLACVFSICSYILTIYAIEHTTLVESNPLVASMSPIQIIGLCALLWAGLWSMYFMVEYVSISKYLQFSMTSVALPICFTVFCNDFIHVMRWLI